MSDTSQVALYNTRLPGASRQPKSTPWTALVLENGWVPAAGEQPLQVRVDSQGNVHMRGVIDGTGATDDQFTTLPEAFRPVLIRVRIGVPVTEPTGLLMRSLVVGLTGFVIIEGFAGSPGSTTVTFLNFSQF